MASEYVLTVCVGNTYYVHDIYEQDTTFNAAQTICKSYGFDNISIATLEVAGTVWLTEDELLHPYPF